MAAADVVLCRAGASTVSELAAIAKPSVLVPSPNVTANHQEKNARVLERQGGAVVLLEPDCTVDLLYDTLCQLLADSERRQRMSRALTANTTGDASRTIYNTLLSLLP